MFFKKRNTYEMNVDTANAILQNVFAAEDKTPNMLSFDKIVLRQKANTRFYDKILRVLLLVLTLSFLSPLVIVPVANLFYHPAEQSQAVLLDNYVKDNCLYIQLGNTGILFEEAYMETLDGTRYPVISYEDKTCTLCFPYPENTESNIYIPVEDGTVLHLLLTPQ